MRRSWIFLTVCAALILAPRQADAQQHFQGKTVTLQVGSGAGGRQDRIARTLAKYMMNTFPVAPCSRAGECSPARKFSTT